MLVRVPYLHFVAIVNLPSATLLLVFAYLSDHYKMRSPFVLVGLIMGLIGFTINIADVPIGVKYFGTYFCVAGPSAALPGVVSW